jgi:hypothetical protein
MAYNETDTIRFNDICDFLVISIETENIIKFHDLVKPNVDIYSVGITNQEVFDNPNKILKTKSEEIIVKKGFIPR